MKPEIVFTREEINEMVSDIAAKLTEMYKDSKVPPVFVGVLKGAVPFMMDLIKKCSFPLNIDFIQVTSYSGTASTGVVHLKKDLSESVKDKDVVIIEDIVDTGSTLSYLKQYIQVHHQPKSVKIVCLIDKKPLRRVNLEADVVGATLTQNKFIVGYGFDYNELGRNIDYIFVPTKKQLNEWDKLNKRK